MSIKVKLILLFSTLFLSLILINNLLLFFNSGILVNNILQKNMDKTFQFINSKFHAYQKNVEYNRESTVNAYIRALADEMYLRVEEIYSRYTKGTINKKQMEQAIETYILDSKILKTGYSFAMDNQGTLTIHFKSKGTNLKGSAHIDEMILKKNGVIHYVAITTGMEKVVAYRYFAPLDMIIAPGVNVEELDWLHDEDKERQFLDDLKEEINTTRIGNHGMVLIIDQAGNIIAAPEETPPEITAKLPEFGQKLQSSEELSVFMMQGFTVIGKPLTADSRFLIGFLPAREIIDLLSGPALISLLIFAGSIIVLIITTIITASRFSKPIREIGYELNRIATGRGDLTRHLSIKQKNEIGSLAENFNNFIDKLNKDMLAIDRSTMRFAIFASDISSSSQQLADASDQQASEIGDVLSEVENFNKDLIAISENTDTLFKVINENENTLSNFHQENQKTIDEINKLENKVFFVIEKSESGRSNILATTEITDSLYQNLQKVRQVINLVEEQTNNIAGMLKVINDISEQTHILAINASIEAANAGFAGRGFTIIAQEIRKLSANTANSVKEVRTFLEEARSGMLAVSQISTNWASQTESLKDSTRLSSESFTSVAESIRQVGSIMNEVIRIMGGQNQTAEEALASSRNLQNHSEAISQAIFNQQTGYKRLSEFVYGVAGKAKLNARAASLLSRLGLSLKIGEYELLRIVKRFNLNESDEALKYNRNSERIDLIHYIEIYDQNDDKCIGYISNISRTGFKFLTDVLFPKEQTLNIFLRPPAGMEDITPHVKMKIQIVWQEERQEYLFMQTGCKIEELAPDEQKRLDEIIDRIFANDPFKMRDQLKKAKEELEIL